HCRWLSLVKNTDLTIGFRRRVTNDDDSFPLGGCGCQSGSDNGEGQEGTAREGARDQRESWSTGHQAEDRNENRSEKQPDRKKELTSEM
ncbi:MAG: hypothetical protein KDM63_07065, partial [Verrucomicrobiae bacterium]|nr:hypothetical protein [Verrucomicrobiae bacterium]